MGGSGGWGVGWVGMGSGGVGKVPRISPEVSENFPGIFGDNRKLQRDIVQRRNKISTHGLYVCTKMILCIRS